MCAVNLLSLQMSRCTSTFGSPALWSVQTISTGCSWVWPMGSTRRRSKGGRRVRFEVFSHWLKWACFEFHQGSEFLSQDPLHTTLSIYRFLQVLPILIPSGTGVITCLSTTSLKGSDFMIYVCHTHTFENNPFITLFSKSLIWAHQPFLAELWLGKLWELYDLN